MDEFHRSKIEGGSVGVLEYSTTTIFITVTQQEVDLKAVFSI